MSTTKKASKKQKPSKSRPQATHTLSQPLPVDSEGSSLASLSSYSPDGKLFALLSLAVDKHRLRVFDTLLSGGKVVAEYTLQVSSVTSLRWGKVFLGEGSSVEVESEKKGRSKKRKRTLDGTSTAPVPSQVIILGLANGSITFFSPSHGSTTISLSHSGSTAAILDVVMDEDGRHLWTSGKDGFIRLWDTKESQDSPIVYSSDSGDRTPYSTIALRPSQSGSTTQQLLAANHSIYLLEIDISPPTLLNSSSRIATTKAHWTGHTTPVSSIHWLPSQEIFITTAERDRFVQAWSVPTSLTSLAEGQIEFSASVDGSVQKVQLNTAGDILFVVSSTGNVGVFMSLSSESKGSLEVTSLINVGIAKGKTTEPIDILDVSLSLEEDGGLQLACLAEGARPVFQTTRLQSESGDIPPKINVKISRSAISQSEDALILPQRYREQDGVAVGSGTALPQGEDVTMDDAEAERAAGTLDTEMAELTLGQRLKAITGENIHSSSSESEVESTGKRRKRKKNAPVEGRIEVPTESLSRTLIQALHSGDTKLMEACLRHSDATLIRNTVQRIPQQLAVPLLTACVERLGRGRGGNTGRSRGAAASAQRGTTMVAWIRTVLIVHNGYLMTLPNLVARLSSLHATLSSRMALHERLLMLNGRLDVALAQVELRWSQAPGGLTAGESKSSKKFGEENVTRYVEGESDDDIEVEKESEDGSVEEIGLKTMDDNTADEDEDEDVDVEDDEDEESPDEEDSDEEEESDDSAEGPRINGFVDDEAEESWGSESDVAEEDE